jgi:hypothetical protein
MPDLVAMLIVAAWAGLGIMLWIDRRATGSLLVGESILLGLAVCAAGLFMLSFIGVAWSRLSFCIAMALVTAVAWAAKPRGRGVDSPTGVRRHPATFALHLLTLALLAGYATFATIAPVWEFDFITDWGLKAQAFAVAHRFDWSFLDQPLHGYISLHPEYPPLLPVIFDVLAVIHGGWNGAAMGGMNVVFAIGLLLVMHGLALEDTGSPLAAAFVMLAMVPFACSPWIGMAEGPLVAYGTAALLLIRRGSVTPGAIMLGLAAATKNEGLTLVFAALLAFLADRRIRAWKLWPALAIPIPWLILLRLHGLQSYVATGSASAAILAHLRDPRPLFEALANNIHGKSLFWAALAIGVMLVVGPLWRRERFVLVSVTLQLTCYLGAYLASPYDLEWHVRYSWERLLSHVNAALVYVVLVTLLGRVVRTSAEVANDSTASAFATGEGP